MASNDMNLGDLRNIKASLSRLPNGGPAVDLAARLGLWSSEQHAQVIARKSFPQNLATLTADAISNENGYWTSEYGRIREIDGAINGQRELNKIHLKRAQAAARGRVRLAIKEGEKLTATQVNDKAEEDIAVLDLAEQAALIELLSAHAKAALEGTSQYLATLSREITLRTANLPGRTNF
jgi:hypothetical protein